MGVEFIDDLRSIETQWVRLYESSPKAAPFQHPAWLIPWWDVFGSGRLFTLASFDDGYLTALFPAFLHEWEGRQQITFLGNGVSDQMDMLGRAEDYSDVWDVLKRSKWDVLHLEGLPASSAFVQDAKPGTITARRCLSDDFEATLPHGLRRNLRRYFDKLRAHGRVEFRSASFHDFDAFLALHRKRWHGGQFEGPLERFHRDAARRMWDVGKARLRLLLLDGKPIAGIYGFVDKGRFWSYQSGFDPAFAAFSPGALVLHFAMREAMEEGCTAFDFLRGDEPYKLTWGAQFSNNYELYVCHTSAR